MDIEKKARKEAIVLILGGKPEDLIEAEEHECICDKCGAVHKPNKYSDLEEEGDSDE